MAYTESAKKMINATGKIAHFVCTKKYLVYLFAAAIYLFTTAFYMGPALTNCTDHIYGFGDSTAGPIWRETLKPEQPVLGGYETATNYPYGESLYSPISIVSIVQTVTIRALSKIAGPVCAYNLYNIIGYLVTSMLMFGFILFLTRSRGIALLAGYMVAFTPYVQSKVGGHPSYGFAGLLIAILWLLLHVVRYRKIVHAVSLGIVIAICAYFDPYFALLAMTLIASVLIAWIIVYGNKLKRWVTAPVSALKDNSKLLKPFMVAILVFLVLVSPLIIVRIKEGDKISASVSGVRGNVMAAAMLCSNKPVDYLLPDPNNKHLVGMLGPKYTPYNISLRSWCGYGESRVSISLTAFTVLFITIIILLWEKLNGRSAAKKVLSHYDNRLIVWSFVAIGVGAFIIGLPPYISGLITPSGIILKITETWRIFAREYMLVNISVVLLLSVSLKYLGTTKAFKQRKLLKSVILIAIFAGVIFEYQINDPFSPPTFSYKRDIPSVYYQVRDNVDIRAIAEYPIDRTGIEYDSIVYYATMQVVHGKSILNSAAITDSKEKLHIALKDLTDPQTLGVLRTLGVHYVVIHGEKLEDIAKKLPGVEIIGQDNPTTYGLTVVRSDDTNQIALAKIPDGPEATSVLVISRGYVVNLDITHSPINVEFEVLNDAQLQVDPLTAENFPTLQCFDIKMSSPLDEGKLDVLLNGTVNQGITITGQYAHIEIIAAFNDTITLHNEKGYNMRLNNLGCK